MAALRGEPRSALTIWMGAASPVRTVHLYAGDGKAVAYPAGDWPYYVSIYYHYVNTT